jgi:DUF917 family protein
MPVEIGRSNALVPLCIRGDLNLPIFDGDLVGRALPDIYLTSTNIFDRYPNRAYIGNPITGKTEILSCSSFEDLEKKARSYAVQNAMTCSVLIPLVLTGAEIKKMAIQKTVSQAITIGENLQKKIIPDQVNCVFEGTVKEWGCEIKNGFLRGVLVFDSGFKIQVRNEYLVLSKNNIALKKAPDIITLLNADDYSPLLSDQIKVGGRVKCLTFDGPQLWSQGKGLALLEKSMQEL